MLVLLTGLGCIMNISAAGQKDSETVMSAKTATDLNIVYIPKNTGNPYFDSIIGGFKKASDELGFTFSTVAPATAEATSHPLYKNANSAGCGCYRHFPQQPRRS
jgi:ABC-type sugar transport system substrate-binding protein